jgi:hypothetical protein
MLTDGNARIACTSDDCITSGVAEHKDWVLKPNTTYKRPDGTLIGTTNENGLFNIPLTNSYAVDPVGSNEAARVWVGWGNTWYAQDNCTGWTVSTGWGGYHARQDATNSQAIHYSTQMCSDTNPIACVEQ